MKMIQRRSFIKSIRVGTVALVVTLTLSACDSKPNLSTDSSTLVVEDETTESNSMKTNEKESDEDCFEWLLDSGILTGLSEKGLKQKKIVVPARAVEIYPQAFSASKVLETLVLPSTVTEMKQSCCAGITSLKSVVYEVSTENMPGGMFQDCTALESVQINSQLTSIGSAAFQNCTSLEEINLPVTLEEIDMGAFYGCSKLKKIVFPDKISVISSTVCSGCTALSEIVFPSALTEIESRAFAECTSLGDIMLPEGLTTLRTQAFEGCSLTSVTLPASLSADGFETGSLNLADGATVYVMQGSVFDTEFNFYFSESVVNKEYH